MAERKIRHVENVFTDDEKKSKGGGLFKSKKAPEPPAGHKPLPKIGNYQPKMVLEAKGPGSSHNDRIQTPGHVERRSRSSGDCRRSSSDVGRQKSPSPPPRKRREFIIGDKNIPLTIERPIDEEADDPVPPPRRKRRAPSVPEDDERRRNNPMYERSVSQRSDTDRLDRDFEVQGGDIDFSPGIDNPGFRSRERRISERSDHYYERNGPEPTGRRRNVIPEPAPDYDDEEVTINFDETTDELVLHYRNSTNANTRSQVCRDIEGEDFGQYIEEDDYEFDNPPYANGHMHTRPRKEGKYQKGPKPSKKPNKKQMQLNNKRNTIRDFTFSDSKIGWGDRTVKSTSAKGRNIKREKERNRMDVTEHFNRRGPAPGSYEEFLNVRNGIPTESPNSSDSGVDVEDNGRPRSEGFYDKQPKHLRDGGKYEHKPSMWQRLTWRFKRTVDITTGDDRY